MRKGPQASQQRRRRPRRTEFLDPRAGVLQCVERQIDTIKSRVIGMTILDVVVDLQGRTQRIVRRPNRIGLAVNVEDKTSNRHRRISAVSDQLVPSPVAQLGYIHAERREQILGMACRQVPVFKRGTQSLRHRLALDMAEKAGLKRIKMGEFLSLL